MCVAAKFYWKTVDCNVDKINEKCYSRDQESEVVKRLHDRCLM